MDRGNVIDRIHDAIDAGVCVDMFMDVLELQKEQKEKMEHLNNITLEYAKEVFRLQTLLKEQEGK